MNIIPSGRENINLGDFKEPCLLIIKIHLQIK